ncbi:hypothetical protein WA026_019130 [Henosepilachna vigintioctopunctata]|uniref:Uncharacterized protein n=1 Tax=Henosepilachna vigintioctopunctata TaxID=420089 RepID=A0AAW1UTT2_9CUCU
MRILSYLLKILIIHVACISGSIIISKIIDAPDRCPEGEYIAHNGECLPAWRNSLDLFRPLKRIQIIDTRLIASHVSVQPLTKNRRKILGR